MEDQGRITCRAENVFGVRLVHVKLIIFGKYVSPLGYFLIEYSKEVKREGKKEVKKDSCRISAWVITIQQFQYDQECKDSASGSQNIHGHHREFRLAQRVLQTGRLTDRPTDRLTD